jgi:WD40 repeat protein
MLKKIITGLLGICIALFAENVYTPVQQIEVNGTAKDLVLHENHLIIGTDSGRLQVYDYEAKKFVKEIKIPDIKDFTGETVSATVFSVDYTDGRYLLLSDSGIGGYSNLWIHDHNKTVQLINDKDHKPLIKARFIDKDHILLGYLSNEAALYDIKNKKEIYKEQLSPSKFSDFALDTEKEKAAFGCESGVISVIYVKDGKLIKDLQGINKDNVYKVDIKKDIVVGAGQDRRGSIYDLKTGKGDFIQGSFLIYATALSPSAKRVAFAMDEQNYISIYKVDTKEKIALLKGQKSTLNAIIFKDETTLFSGSDDSTVLMWKLK